MEEYMFSLKDLLVVISPIIIAYISYKSNKMSKEDIRLEIEKNLKEKDAETSQIIQKINAELESKKIITSWNNTLPQTNEYAQKIGIERYCNVSALRDLIPKIETYINVNNLSVDELSDIKEMLLRIELPKNDENLYPHEIPYLIDYKRLLNKIDDLISSNSQS